MPRIELIPPGWDNSREKQQGDGTPTIDVCRGCSTLFTEGEPLDLDNFDDLAEPEGTIVGSTDVTHPEYDDERCEACGAILGEDDE